MGIEIRYQDFTHLKKTENRLLVYYRGLQNLQDRPVSVNIELSRKLVKIKSNRRSMKLEQCVGEVLAELPDGVIIRDFDVMFHPDYQVDVLKILTDARRQKNYSVKYNTPAKLNNFTHSMDEVEKKSTISNRRLEKSSLPIHPGKIRTNSVLL